MGKAEPSDRQITLENYSHAVDEGWKIAPTLSTAIARQKVTTTLSAKAGGSQVLPAALRHREGAATAGLTMDVR